MHRIKKGPMYQSITSPNDTKCYDFVDFTNPNSTPTPNAANRRESRLIKKIETIYRSQLLNIEQSKQQDNHVDQTDYQTEKLKEVTLGDRTNIGVSYEPLQSNKKIRRTDTIVDNINSQRIQQQRYNNKNSIQNESILNKLPFSVRRSRTIIEELLIDNDQKIINKNKSNNYLNSSSQFTSDDIIQIMANPFKESLWSLKSRVKAKNYKIL